MRASQKILHFVFFVFLCGFFLGACAPTLKIPGPQTTAPQLDEKIYTTADGVKLPVHSWQPTFTKPRAVLVALHGFNDYGNFFDTPGIYLANEGIVSYAYDQRGFGGAPHRGLWAGVNAYTDDLAVFTRLVRARHPKLPVFILGNSMGGAVTLAAMARATPPPVDGVVLSASAIWGRKTMPWYQRWVLAIASHTVPWLTLTGRSLRKVPSDNIDMLRKLSRDPLVIKETRIDTIYGLVNLMDAAFDGSSHLKAPALMLYGKKDEIIPAEPTYKAFRKVLKAARKNQTVAVYATSYHMMLRDLAAHKVLNDIAAWITDRAKPLPSGADKRALEILK
ncbi:lysophospholipase [bacterium]|jgi:acylglycerol lipase|nr:lysophospholipase [bacterium]